MRVNISLAKSASISYRLKIEMATNGVYLHFKINSWFALIHECNTQIHKCNIYMPGYCSINRWVCVRYCVSDLMSIFDPNSTPVSLL